MSVRISLKWCHQLCTRVVVESLKEVFGEDVEISITSGNIAVDLHYTGCPREGKNKEKEEKSRALPPGIDI